MKDKIVERVVSKYNERSELGMKKYNTTLEDNNLTLVEWLIHLQEELMDATLYIEKSLSKLNDKSLNDLK
jgi:tRNA A37 threonylcarbamoyladenosine biosynthesis protein TsaE